MSNQPQPAGTPEENNLAWLQSWYADQCDGKWEHGWGVRIGTLDNPGWELEINLAETRLADVAFSPLEREDEEDWFVCKVDENVFKAYGGAKNLNDMIDVFRQWATNAEKKEHKENV